MHSAFSFKLTKPGRRDRIATLDEKAQACEIMETIVMPALRQDDYSRAANGIYRMLKFLPRDRQGWELLLLAVSEGTNDAQVHLDVAKQALEYIANFEPALQLRIDAAYRLDSPQELLAAIPPYVRACGHRMSKTQLRDLQTDLAAAEKWAQRAGLRTTAADESRHLPPFSRSPRQRPADRGRSKRTPAAGASATAATAAAEAKPVPLRDLTVPRDSAEGAAVRLRCAPISELLARFANKAQGKEGLAALDLLLAAADARATEEFDQLLSLERVRGVQQFPHQIETVLRVLKRFHGRVLLADEVGLGKTIEAGLVLSEYLLRGLVQRALILCPPALVTQWRSEMHEKFAISAKTNLDPEFTRDPIGFFAQPGVLIASLALCRLERHRHTLMAQHFDLIVVDEAHHLKNRNTLAWELVNALRSRFLLLLTATPVETNLTELYNLVTLLRPGTLGTEAEFRKRFITQGDPLSPREPERLRDLLRAVMIRNTRAQSGIALPPRTARTVIVEPSAQEHALYAALIDLARAVGNERPTLFRLLFEEAGSSPNAVAHTAAQATEQREPVSQALQELAKLAGSVRRWAKLDRLIELLPGGKVLVFTRFLATHEALAGRLREQGVAFASFTGSMSAAQRQTAVEAFAGPSDVLLCSEVGGEGQNLQFCHRIINFDLPWNPMLIEQRIGRVHRIGQRETVEIVNLCTGGTAEDHILNVFDLRVNLFELVVGEVDLLLGELEDEREFGDRVYDIYATSRSAEDVSRGFDNLAQLLEQARDRMTRARAADTALFGDTLGV